jgi:hydrogenase nickel incorporation protein HypB
MLLNKVDIMEHTDFNKEAFDSDIRRLNGTLPVFEVSLRQNRGLDAWIGWLEKTFRETVG